MRSRLVACIALVAGLAFCAAASAQTLYKLIDKNGKVTYSESPPKPDEFDGQVIRIDVDPNANRATLPKAAPGAFNPPMGEVVPEPLRLARLKLDRAQKALQYALDNPGADDVQRVGNVGGGSRPVPTEAYQQRLAKLQEDVRNAEEELRRVDKPAK